MTESEPVPVRTFEQPTDIEMLDVTNTSIHVSWRFPVDFYSVRLVYIFYEQVIKLYFLLTRFLMDLHLHGCIALKVFVIIAL